MQWIVTILSSVIHKSDQSPFIKPSFWIPILWITSNLNTSFSSERMQKPVERSYRQKEKINPLIETGWQHWYHKGSWINNKIWEMECSGRAKIMKLSSLPICYIKLTTPCTSIDSLRWWRRWKVGGKAYFLASFIRTILILFLLVTLFSKAFGDRSKAVWCGHLRGLRVLLLFSLWWSSERNLSKCQFPLQSNREKKSFKLIWSFSELNKVRDVKCLLCTVLDKEWARHTCHD